MTGRIDVHSHLLPSVDDGCASVEESLACARRFVSAGYTHAFCTPHMISSFPQARHRLIPGMVASLQQSLDTAKIPLKLLPGGEMNFPQSRDLPDELTTTYNQAGRYALVDMWASEIPAHFEPSVRLLQEQGLTVILAHPERMRAVQDNPALADYFQGLGLLLQGNLQCFSDPDYAHTRRVAEQYLAQDRYFMLGSDCHQSETLDCRLRGIDRAIKLVGNDAVDRLMIDHPRKLIGDQPEEKILSTDEHR